MKETSLLIKIITSGSKYLNHTRDYHVMKFAHNMTKLHIVVIFAVVVFATSLENKCNVPPEFWCSSEEVARDCQVEFTNLMNV